MAMDTKEDKKFSESENPTPPLIGNNDYDVRYEKIFGDKDVKKKTLLDVCCGNAYFMVKFMLDGGLRAVGVENNLNILKEGLEQASAHNVDITMTDSLKGVSGQFDYVLYLDTHYHRGTDGYLDMISKLGKEFYVSSSYSSAHRERSNERLEKDLKDIFSSIEFVYTANNKRNIYRCFR